MFFFFKEHKLILTTNLAGSYYHECFVRGIVKTLNCLQNLIFEYGKRNLYDNDKKKSNIQQDFGETSF